MTLERVAPNCLAFRVKAYPAVRVGQPLYCDLGGYKGLKVISPNLFFVNVR
jgi:hypothetical protein